jgi:hypothetical protein
MKPIIFHSETTIKYDWNPTANRLELSYTNTEISKILKKLAPHERLKIGVEEDQHIFLNCAVDGIGKSESIQYVKFRYDNSYFPEKTDEDYKLFRHYMRKKKLEALV